MAQGVACLTFNPGFKPGDIVMVTPVDYPAWEGLVIDYYPPGCREHDCPAWVIEHPNGTQGVICERHLALPNKH